MASEREKVKMGKQTGQERIYFPFPIFSVPCLRSLSV